VSAHARPLSVALVHHPVLDQAGKTVTATITNLDVHDIARSARTFGCEAYYLVHPIVQQRTLVDTICTHWTSGSSAKRIPDRKNALAIVRTSASLEALAESLGGRSAFELWVTSAKATPTLSWTAGRERLEAPGLPVLLLFGTSWGLAPSVMEQADHVLPSLNAQHDSGFNHLSVRAACAIMLDRLRGQR
jgi:hypothetical protein